jgi:hypothetical protein
VPEAAVEQVNRLMKNAWTLRAVRSDCLSRIFNG